MQSGVSGDVYATNWYYKTYVQAYLEGQNTTYAIAFIIFVSSLISK